MLRRRVTERETTWPFWSRLINSHTQWSNVTVDTCLFIIVIEVSGHTGNFLFRGKISRWVSYCYWSTIRAAHYQVIWIKESTVLQFLQLYTYERKTKEPCVLFYLPYLYNIYLTYYYTNLKNSSQFDPGIWAQLCGRSSVSTMHTECCRRQDALSNMDYSKYSLWSEMEPIKASTFLLIEAFTPAKCTTSIM